ncbi:MAG TPA: DUF3109 family protein [Bacteroidales bacterium]|nr:DUF3109 family protein [Bacteroidales bacterium]
MIQIDDYLISLDVLDRKFACDLPVCLGNCCRYGDSGAPLTGEEAVVLEEIKETVLPYLGPRGRDAIAEKGTSMKDFEGETVTPLIGNEECAYTILNGNIFMCGIEKAWADGKIGFRKPLSCHLFPVRMKKYQGFTAVNYEELSICQPARHKGAGDGVYVYRFLREPLIRAMGADIYEKICIAADHILKKS